MNTCNECKWWNREPTPRYHITESTGTAINLETSIYGQCRRRGPSYTPHTWNDWPRTEDKDWCGEWEARETDTQPTQDLYDKAPY